MKRCVLLYLLAALPLGACAYQSNYLAQIPVTRLESGGQQKTESGIYIKVLRITSENIDQFHLALRPTLRYQLYPVSLERQKDPLDPLRGTVRFPLVPLPSFAIAVTNRTGHPIILTPASFQLRTGEQSYSAYQDRAALFGRYAIEIAERGYGRWAGLADTGIFLLTQFPLLTAPVSLPNGESWHGFLTFNTEAYNEDEANELVTQKQLELQFLFAGEQLLFRLQPKTLFSTVSCAKNRQYRFDPSLRSCFLAG